MDVAPAPDVHVSPTPQHVIAVCCPRMLCVDGSFIQCPSDRRMYFFPDVAEYHCLQCNRAVSTSDDSLDYYLGGRDDPPYCPFHGYAVMEVDQMSGDRQWVCGQGTVTEVPISPDCHVWLSWPTVRRTWNAALVINVDPETQVNEDGVNGEQLPDNIVEVTDTIIQDETVRSTSRA